MINYYLPDFYTGRKLYELIYHIKKEYPEFFYDNISIKAIFGCFPGAIWNGGSIFNTAPTTYASELKDFYYFYKDLNIPIQITFTNPLITEKQCWDTYCNTILEYFEDSDNAILVSNEILEKYIKNNYPKYKIDRSIVNTGMELDWINLLKTKYNRVVMPRRHNKDFNYLKNIPKEYRNRIELLVNEDCPSDCPRINTHYNAFALTTLFKNPDNLGIPCTNELKKDNFFGVVEKDYISFDEIRKNYEPLNYTEIKLSGRADLLHMIYTVCEYMIIPKYKLQMMKFLCSILL